MAVLPGRSASNKIPVVMRRNYPSLLLLVALCSLLSFSCGEDEPGAATFTSENGLPRQTSRSGEVEAAVTPGQIRADSESWDFQVVLDTHTIELSEDLQQAAVLADDTGREFKPTAYEGDPPGGHHRTGILKFEPVTPLPKSVTLKLRGVGGIGERSFSWMLPPAP